MFSPYQTVKDEYRAGRSAGAALVKTSAEQARRAFIYVNNRFEGNALETIAAIIEQAGEGP
jgi:hypothetical protein